MIDRLRHDIQQRLEQLLGEADKLRHALAALSPRHRPAPAPTGRRAPRPAQPRTRSATTAKPSAPTAPGAKEYAVDSDSASQDVLELIGDLRSAELIEQVG